MKKTNVITLQAGEMAVCTVLAEMRNAVARSSSVVNAKMGKQSDYQTDLDGMVAEVAFSKWRNCYPDLTIGARSGGVDCVLNGKKIDVKSTRYPNGKLLATLSKAVDEVDIYVLAVVNGNQVTFPGWAHSHELINEQNIVDLGHGRGYALNQSQLRKFDTSSGSPKRGNE